MENETIVLAISYMAGNITIRIDQNGLAKPDFNPSPVTVLELEACEPDQEVQDILSGSIDKSIYYEIQPDKNGVQVSFWIDYRNDEFKIICSQLHSSSSDYTFEELKRKCERLAAGYLAEQRVGEVNSFLYQVLLDRLQKEAHKEVDLCQRKIEFFRGNNPEKENRYAEMLKISRRILSLIGWENHQDLRALIRSQFRSMWDENGFDCPTEQNQHIKAEIIALGEAAIFPLLEMLGEPNPLMRKEILNLVEQINPDLSYWLQKRLILF